MANNINQTVDQLNQSLSSASNSVENFQNALDGSVNDFRNAMNGGNRDVKEFGNKLKSEALVLGKQFGTLAQTLSQGNGTLARYNNIVDSTTGSISKIAFAFGSLGGVVGKLSTGIGFLVTAIGFAVKTVNEFNDNLLRGSDVLAKVGTAGRLTTDELLQMTQNAGFANDQTADFAFLLKEVGPDVLTLGKSATDGYKALGNITVYSSEMIANFRRLGVTNEDLVRNTVDYVKLQSLSGISLRYQNLITGDLTKRTVQYTRDLIELSDFTGLEVEEVKRRQMVARASLDLQTRDLMMQDKIAQLREKGANQEADDLEKERERTRKMVDMASMLGLSGENLAAVQSMLATGTFNELSSSFAAGMPGILEFFKAVKEGKKQPEEFAKFLAEANAQNRKNFGEAITLDKNLGNAVAYNTETLAIESRFRNLSMEDIQKEIERRKALRQAEEQYSLDARQNQRAAAVKAEQDAKLIRDRLIDFGDKMFGITKILTKFGEVLGDITGWIGKKLITIGALGKEMLPLFMSVDELQSGIREFDNQITEANKKRESLLSTEGGRKPTTAQFAQATQLDSEIAALVESRKTYENALKGQTVSQFKRGEAPLEVSDTVSTDDLKKQLAYLNDTRDQFSKILDKGENEAIRARLELLKTDINKLTTEISKREGNPVTTTAESDGAKKSGIGSEITYKPAEKAPSIYAPKEEWEEYNRNKNKPAKFGGIFTGPLDGYDAPHRSDMTMHQTELIQPLSQNSILQELATKSVSEYITQNAISNEKSDLMPILISRVDELIRIMRDSNNIQNDILNYSIS